MPGGQAGLVAAGALQRVNGTAAGLSVCWQIPVAKLSVATDTGLPTAFQALRAGQRGSPMVWRPALPGHSDVVTCPCHPTLLHCPAAESPITVHVPSPNLGGQDGGRDPQQGGQPRADKHQVMPMGQNDLLRLRSTSSTSCLGLHPLHANNPTSRASPELPGAHDPTQKRHNPPSGLQPLVWEQLLRDLGVWRSVRGALGRASRLCVQISHAGEAITALGKSSPGAVMEFNSD